MELAAHLKKCKLSITVTASGGGLPSINGLGVHRGQMPRQRRKTSDGADQQ